MKPTPVASRAVTLRPVAAADQEFLIALYGSTRADELALVAWPAGQLEAFVRMQFDLQDRQFRANHPDASFDVIEVDGQEAGRLYVDRRPGEVRLVDIALVPEHRGHGIGQALLTGLMAEAAEAGGKVSLHVELHNRAAALYSRLGFVVVGEQGLYAAMEWVAR